VSKGANLLVMKDFSIKNMELESCTKRRRYRNNEYLLFITVYENIVGKSQKLELYQQMLVKMMGEKEKS